MRFLSVLGLGSRRLSRQLTGAFIVVIAGLAAITIFVARGITTEIVEARAESALASDESVVLLYFRELEDEIVLLNELLAGSQMLTEQLTVPSASRSLTISLIADLSHRGMSVRTYEEKPAADEPSFPVIQKGFLGIRTLGLVTQPGPMGGIDSWLISVAPVETKRGVESVVSIWFPVNPAYLKEIADRIGSDVTLLLDNGQVISSLPAGAAVPLVEQVRGVGSGKTSNDQAWSISALVGDQPVRALLTPFAINMKTEGALLLSMPMTDLLAARRQILLRGVLSALVVLSGASLFYLALVRRITRPLAHLSAATHEVAAGKLDVRVDVSGKDEVAELAACFNTMIERLKESREEIEAWNLTLERRVEERTVSLEAARAQLKASNEQLVEALDELRRTQGQMIRTEKLAALGQMASAVAHEVRNPLTGMKGVLQVLAREETVGERAMALQLVVEQIDRLADTTSRLLSFARPATPRQTPSDVTELLRQTRALVDHEAGVKGVAIEMDLETVDRLFSVDPQLTVQAFLNLALNAIQAMSRGGTLTIASRWRGEDEALVVTFRDTGPGIAPEDHDRIFTPFFTTKHQGTGLGLYVAKEIIEQQGGHIELASTPGSGTVFTVTLAAAS